MKIIAYHTVKEITAALEQERHHGKSIGFVPTMGALHSGHQSLLEQAARENQIVVCSIFVNPTQFNNASDLANYPRMIEQDLMVLEKSGCHYAFVPSVEEMYPQGQQTLDIHFGNLALTMEGAFRPGHFNGMATIVDRLFNIVQPDRAYFGEKDFQQLAIVRVMAKMLNHKVQIVGCPTLREHDGLAMSSRNLLLNEKQRSAAPMIYQAMLQAKEFIPHHSPAAICDLVIRYIQQSPLFHVQYFEIVDPETLEPITQWEPGKKAQGCIAVLTEGPRLIDNIEYLS
ncbi:pantoate--beta-alanine ligase [soil metagenome]